MARPTRVTLLQLATENLRTGRYRDGEPVNAFKAYVLAAEAITTAMELALTARKIDADGGDWPTQAEYADRAGFSERSAQRQWARFHEAFGQRPDALSKHLYVEIGRRLDESPVVVGDLTVPDAMLAAAA